jgi:hypothetical protein
MNEDQQDESGFRPNWLRKQLEEARTHVESWERFQTDDYSLRVALANALGCSVEIITVENIKALFESIKPFAEFNNTLKEWWFGKEGFPLMERHPNHIPVMTGRYPADIQTMHVRKLMVKDFEKAEKSLEPFLTGK